MSGTRLAAVIALCTLMACPEPITGTFPDALVPDVGVPQDGGSDGLVGDQGGTDVAPDLNPWNPPCVTDSECEVNAGFPICFEGACIANECVTVQRYATKKSGGSLEDRWSAILPLGDGAEDVMLVGSTASKGAGGFDISLARATNGGALRWSRTFGTADNEIASAAALVEGGGVVAGGGAGTQGWVGRFDADGGLLWQWTGGASVAAVAVSGDRVYAAGWTGADTMAVWQLGLADGAQQDANTSLGTGRLKSIVVTGEGEFVVAGWTNGGGGRQAWAGFVQNGTLGWGVGDALVGADSVNGAVAGLDGDIILTGTHPNGRGWVASVANGAVGWLTALEGPSAPNAVATTRDYGYVVAGDRQGYGFMAQVTRAGVPMWFSLVLTGGGLDAVAMLSAPPRIVGVGGDGDATWSVSNPWGQKQCLPDSACTTLLPGECDLTDPCETVGCHAIDGCAVEARTCDDENPCTEDSCDPGGGCVFDPAPLALAACDDGDACTLNDACDGAGACLGELLDCDDGNVCTSDSCDAATGCVYEAAAGSCDDGSVCTEGDSCGNGLCAGTPIDCPGGDGACEVASCDPVAGCQVVTAPNGTSCDDANPCSTGDQCVQGTCLGAPLICDGGDGCTGTVCELTTGNCVAGNAADGTPCDDGDACQFGETCQAGSCTSTGQVVDCDDGNPCTFDSCDPVAGCTAAAVADGTGCDDGDLCTSGETCQAGACSAGTVVTCDDSNPCSADACNPATGTCEYEVIGDGGTCETGDACSTGTCNGGICNEVPVVCADDGNPCTVGACVPGVGCEYAPVSDGTTCDDGSPCTVEGVCAGGTCTGQDPVICSATGACDDGYCDEATGDCVPGNAPDGATCDDGDGCTTGDTCLTGVCEGGVAVSCDDGNACTIDGTCSAGSCPAKVPLNCVDGDPCTADQACDPDIGCTYGDGTGTACDDGDACTENDTCQGQSCQPGAAVNCDDGNVCTEDLACDAVNGCQYNPLTIACDDGNECTDNDVCDGAGTCAGVGLVCDDDNPCTVDTCSLTTGCEFTTVPDASSCEDGEVCTVGDTCQSGVCTAGPLDSCDDGDVCSDDTCVTGVGCSNTPNTGAACDDGDPCTSNDACSAGTCVGGGATVCDDGLVCTDDYCDTVIGCATTNNTAPCDDGDACTTGDTCSGGTCASGAPAICNDGDVCTDDGCDAGTGCTATFNTAPCDDGDACTVGDVCALGTCQAGGTPLNCVDGDPCTDDLGCDAVTGCQYTNNTASCEDGDPCTLNDTCDTGNCVSGPVDDCDDGNLCTDDSCTAGVGCVNANNSAPCDDSDACTTGDVCSGGSCQSGSGSPTCDDGNPCTDDLGCDVQNGCEYANNTASCEDGDPCTLNDTCAGGSCQSGSQDSCDDGNLCTDDSCAAGSGCQNVDNTVACDDGDACSVGDACAGGTCQSGGGSPNCDDGNVCTDDLGCDAQNGCEYANNAAACEDGNPCTVGDTCSGGSCQSGAGDTCDDGNICTDDSCDPGSGCVNADNTAACDDGDACTEGDACSGGSCQPGGGTPTCDDGNPCTDNLGCVSPTGCAYADNALPCDDGDDCTASDMCGGGTCVGGTFTDCFDGEDCTQDVCDGAGGCLHPPVTDGTPCDDFDECTENDACSGGFCVGPDPFDCDDSNDCSMDTCMPGIGCEYDFFSMQGSPCDDGDICTGPGTCDEFGACAGGTPLDCDDGDACTDDSCSGGCINTPTDCDDGEDCTTDSCDAVNGCEYVNNTNPCDDGDSCTTGDACANGTCMGGVASGFDLTVDDLPNKGVMDIYPTGSGTFVVSGYEGPFENTTVLNPRHTWLAEIGVNGQLSWTSPPFGQTSYNSYRAVHRGGDGQHCALMDYINSQESTFIRKLDAVGGYVWQQASSAERYTDIIGLANGDCLTVGEDYLNTGADTVWAIRHAAATGAVVWQKSVSPATVEGVAHGVIPWGTGALLGGAAGWVSNPYLVALDDAGDPLWEQSIVLPELNDGFLDIAEASDGGIYGLAKRSDGAKAWVVRFDDAGGWLWTHELAGATWPGGWGKELAPTPDGGVGVLTGTLNVGGDAGTATVHRLDAAGNLVWRRDLDVGQVARPRALVPRGDGFVIGGTRGKDPVVNALEVGPVSGQRAGAATHVAGKLVAVGKPGFLSGDCSGCPRGQVEVFERQSESSWTTFDVVEPFDTTAHRFGHSLHWGSHLVVGAPQGTSIASSPAGSVFIYSRFGSSMSYQGMVNGGPSFGWSVAEQVSSLAVGQPAASTNGVNAGRVTFYGYSFFSGGWGYMDNIEGDEAGDLLGFSMDANRQTFIIGAPGGDYVRVYYKPCNGDGCAWNAVEAGRRFRPADGAPGMQFGYDVAVTDLSVWAIGACPDVAGQEGAVYVFRRKFNTGAEQEAKITAPEPAPNFGCRITMDGERLAVASDTAIYWYEHRGQRWYPIGKTTASTTAAETTFGESLDYANGVLMMGSPGATDGASSQSGLVELQEIRSEAFATTLSGFGIPGCDTNSCSGLVVADCDDSNPCTYDACDGASGCTNDNVPDGTRCEDGDPCTLNDVCAAGSCTSGPADCDDGNPCTDNLGCDPGVGCEFANNTAPCEDGNACTSFDTCADSLCVTGPPTDCDDGTACTDDVGCDPDTGCLYVDNDENICEDGDPCTEGDTCSGGVCQPGGVASWAFEQEIVGFEDSYFASAIAIDGDTVAVGSERDDGDGNNSGAVYVYTRSGTVWSLEQRIAPPDVESGGYFGASVSLSGDTLLVGAYNIDGTHVNQGSAYVFTRSGTTWTLQQQLFASVAAASDRFGRGVALDGTIAVVGAPRSDEGGSDRGTAFVFEFDGSTWNETAKVVSDDPQNFDLFGTYLDVSNSSFIVGVPFDDTFGTSAGAAFVFTKSGSVWSLDEAFRDAPSVTASFGRGVAIHDDHIAVTAQGGDQFAENTGEVWVYRRSGSTWLSPNAVQPPGTVVGSVLQSVALDTGRMLIGDYAFDFGLGTNSNRGRASSYTISGGVATFDQHMPSITFQAGEFHADQVAISGDTAVMGTRFYEVDGEEVGAVRIWRTITCP